jgi:predicted RND superfamily exporter protein
MPGVLDIYRATVLRFPWLALLAVFGVVAAFAAFLPGFKLDVSSDAIILEKDPALRVYDASRLIFGSDDYVLVAYRSEDVFSERNIARLSALTRDLAAIPGVDTVMSLTSESLWRSPPTEGGLLGLMGMAGDPVTLDRIAWEKSLEGKTPAEKEEAEEEWKRRLRLARKEFTESGVYSGNLVTRDGTRTGLLVYLMQESESRPLEARIHEIDKLLDAGTGDRAALRKERREVKARFQAIVDERRDRRARVLGEIRNVLKRHEDAAQPFYSSGLPVIFVDMMNYVRRDMVLFGALVAFFVLAIYAAVFRQVRWVLLPFLSVTATVTIVVGAMVAAGIRTTVITSNLSSLLLILSTAHSVHIANRYSEERSLDPGGKRVDWLLRALRAIGVPCFYIAATTAVGFVCLSIGGSRPVIQFGIYMAIGILLAWAITFLVVPAGLALWPASDGKAPPRSAGERMFFPLARFTVRRRWPLIVGGLVLLAASAAGIARLDVETVFISYFHRDTEIYRGLHFIDRELGGTSSLEVLFEAEDDEHFTTWEALEPLRRIEAYLNTVPEVGKVLSAVTLMDELDSVLVASGVPHPEGRDRQDPKIVLSILTSMGGEEIGKGRAPIYSYVDPKFRHARVFVRIRESAETLRRMALLDNLKAFLAKEGMPPGVKKVEVTGVFVLYTNMLYSLFFGQAWSSILVFVAIQVMMTILFRSAYLGLLALLPNILPIAMILGIMGWTGIPLDMNNIMIASISLGIAVDDTLHYIFRMRKEIRVDGNYLRATFRTFKTVGRAMLLTSVINTVGFLALGFSNFVPTQRFGLFTAFAMVAASFASLTVLPALILVLKPFGKKPAIAGPGTGDGEPGPRTGGRGPETVGRRP